MFLIIDKFWAFGKISVLNINLTFSKMPIVMEIVGNFINRFLSLSLFSIAYRVVQKKFMIMSVAYI